MLFHLFAQLRGNVGLFNVFRYVSTRTMLATMTSLLITFALAPWFIRRARARQLGEVIRDDGPTTHAVKQVTPTMGGALIIMALVTGTVLWCDLSSPLAQTKSTPLERRRLDRRRPWHGWRASLR